MATPLQRLQSIVDAMLNRTATPTELTRLGDALAYSRMDVGYAAKTNSEKAAATVEHLFKVTLRDMKAAENTKALNTAASAPDPDFTPAL